MHSHCNAVTEMGSSPFQTYTCHLAAAAGDSGQAGAGTPGTCQHNHDAGPVQPCYAGDAEAGGGEFERAAGKKKRPCKGAGRTIRTERKQNEQIILLAGAQSLLFCWPKTVVKLS